MSIEGQGHFFTIYFQVLYVLYFTRPRHQVSVYRTTGPLVIIPIITTEDFLTGYQYILVLGGKLEPGPRKVSVLL